MASNTLHTLLDEIGKNPQAVELGMAGTEWPPLPGEYYALCNGLGCPVAVSTLASPRLAETLAGLKPKGLSIVGVTETENIGIDKLIKNTITNPWIKFLILAGKEPEGHLSGRTLLSLWHNGVDEKRRVIGSPGHRPILANTTKDEIEAFRAQVEVVDMIGFEDPSTIIDTIKTLADGIASACDCGSGSCCEAGTQVDINIATAPRIEAHEQSQDVTLDKAGYFVIIPQPEKGVIVVEHYSYDNRLLRTIEGKTARSIYFTIIDNGWVSLLSHAAYLGKELEKAGLSMRHGFKYIQDGA